MSGVLKVREVLRERIRKKTHVFDRLVFLSLSLDLLTFRTHILIEISLVIQNIIGSKMQDFQEMHFGGTNYLYY